VATGQRSAATMLRAADRLDDPDAFKENVTSD
jgi:hypothetical protein